MATTPRDPYKLDYAENYAGTFGSGWRPGEGTAADRAAKAAVDRPIAPGSANAANAVAGSKSLYPSQDRQAKILGQSAAPAAAVAPAVPVQTAPATALAQPAPVSALAGLPQNLPAFAPNVSGVLGGRATQMQFQAPPTAPPTGAERAGSAVRSAIGRGVNALGRAELGAADVVAGGLKSQAGQVTRPVGRALQAVTGFGRGLLGRSTAAGATNASAAQFEQPTGKSAGRPVTPTSPQLNIDRSDQALGKFGLSDAEFSRRKLSFAGY